MNQCYSSRTNLGVSVFSKLFSAFSVLSKRISIFAFYWKNPPNQSQFSPSQSFFFSFGVHDWTWVLDLVIRTWPHQAVGVGYYGAFSTAQATRNLSRPPPSSDQASLHGGWNPREQLSWLLFLQKHAPFTLLANGHHHPDHICVILFSICASFAYMHVLYIRTWNAHKRDLPWGPRLADIYIVVLSPDIKIDVSDHW